MKTEQDMEEASCGRKYEGCFEQARCTFLVIVDCWR